MELTKGRELTSKDGTNEEWELNSRDGTNEGWGIDQQKDLLSDHFVINKYIRTKLCFRAINIHKYSGVYIFRITPLSSPLPPKKAFNFPENFINYSYFVKIS